MYLLAILLLVNAKIEALKANRFALLHEIGSEGSVLRDILLYLNEHLLLDKQFKLFREKLEGLLTALANEYIE